LCRNTDDGRGAPWKLRMGENETSDIYIAPLVVVIGLATAAAVQVMGSAFVPHPRIT
jgi:hypothetical protein